MNRITKMPQGLFPNAVFQDKLEMANATLTGLIPYYTKGVHINLIEFWESISPYNNPALPSNNDIPNYAMLFNENLYVEYIYILNDLVKKGIIRTSCEKQYIGLTEMGVKLALAVKK
jgi:hypothetical protein